MTCFLCELLYFLVEKTTIHKKCPPNKFKLIIGREFADFFLRGNLSIDKCYIYPHLFDLSLVADEASVILIFFNFRSLACGPTMMRPFHQGQCKVIIQTKHYSISTNNVHIYKKCGEN